VPIELYYTEIFKDWQQKKTDQNHIRLKALRGLPDLRNQCCAPQ
jgi:hypothetical protein